MDRRPAALAVVAALMAWMATFAPVAPATPAPDPSGPSLVRVEPRGDGYALLVNGRPFHVRGAGLERGDRAALAARGGNAFRTWRVDTRHETGTEVLDEALEHGLFVALGLEVARERHGFDYDDEAAVARQLARLREEVLRHRDHPALLFWVVGNELNLGSTNPRVWDAVNDIVVMIAELDPRHPALTPLAGFDAGTIAEIRRRAPALGILGVQLYGDIARLGDLRAAGWDGPYLVTEWGPTGHWEVPTTDWGAPIEDSSQRKAEHLAQRYRHILSDPGRCLGSFVFLWGQKQERTPTWYSMFLADGEHTAAVDTMQALWSGAPAARPAPAVDGMRLDGRLAGDGIVATPGQRLLASVEAVPGGPGALRYEWVVRRESQATSIGGDPEALPPRVRVRMRQEDRNLVRFRAPLSPGAYRVFVTVRDDHGGAGHANLPFLVEAAR